MYRHPRFWAIAAALIFLIFSSIYLAMNRIYQVDECQNLFMARILGIGQSNAYFTSAALWLIGPMAWLAGAANSSASLFGWARGIFLCVFWLNILLMTLATGVRLRSYKGCFILLPAATLAPLWDYGFEVRHDNLVLMGLLLIWWLGRAFPKGNRSYFVLGLLTVILPFVAFKSLAYVMPLALLFLVLPPPAHNQNRAKLAIFWLAGALAAFFLCFLIYAYSGLWSVYLSSLKGANVGQKVSDPWTTLGRAWDQTPLLFGLSIAALSSVVGSLCHGFRSAFNWGNYAPEAALFLIALGALFINPAPFPYNLVNLVPFAFLLSCRFIVPRIEIVRDKPKLVLCLSLFLLIHFVPFVNATRRHVDWPNSRQKMLMRAAEALTDPVKDRVYDAIGMVPTRNTIGFYWYLHSLSIEGLSENRTPKVSGMLAKNPSAVFIPSYRTDWLPAVEIECIKKWYIPLSDDFWVLGQTVPTGGGSFDIVHSGKYQLLERRKERMQPLQYAEIDSRLLDSSIVELKQGRHELKSISDKSLAVVWVGPILKNVPNLGRGNHERLFYNWY